MIITRTPFRISFFGGGTDYPVWYENNGGGVVLGTTIDKYCYIVCRYLPPFFNHKYRIRYTLREETQTIMEIKHPSVRECLLFTGVEKGVEVQHNADLPANSGLGSSSSFTVGMLHALYGLLGKMVTKRQLALEAIRVEQEKIGENVGSQDQTLAAFGGLNKVTFRAKREIVVQPVTLSEEKLKFLENHMLLFFTGFSRVASDIAAEQIRVTPQKEKELKIMMQFVEEGIRILNDGQDNYRDFGRLLHEAWKVKRGLTKRISNPQIDEIYEAGIAEGALGGKLLGAGGGGFILLFAPPENHQRIKDRLRGLLTVPFHFENLGSQVVYYAPEEAYN